MFVPMMFAVVLFSALGAGAYTLNRLLSYLALRAAWPGHKPPLRFDGAVRARTMQKAGWALSVKYFGPGFPLLRKSTRQVLRH